MRELATDEGVDVDAPGEDVASGAGEVEACVSGGEVLDDLCGDERQFVAGAAGRRGG